MKKATLILFTILSFTSCLKSNESSKIVGADWLLGKWERNSAEGNLIEIWKQSNDSSYLGESYFIKGKDSLHFEQIQLQQKGDDLMYIATIRGQNNDKPITYIQNKEEEKQLVFENPTNGYPRKIVYSKISKDRMQIQISGIQQGKPSSDRYTLKKIN